MAAKVYDIGVRLATALLIAAKFTLQPTMPPNRAARCSFPTMRRSRSSRTASPCKLGVFSHRTGLLAAGLVFPRLNALVFQEKRSGVEAEEVSPTEDLMREHGLLNRVLLVYEEIGRQLTAKAEFDPKLLANAAGIIQHFIEEYHEKLEEDYCSRVLKKPTSSPIS